MLGPLGTGEAHVTRPGPLARPGHCSCVLVLSCNFCLFNSGNGNIPRIFFCAYILAVATQTNGFCMLLWLQ